MKIAHILTTLELGGAQLSTLRLVKILQQNPKVQVTLVVGEKGPLTPFLKDIKHVIRIPSLKRPPNILMDLFCIFKLRSLFKEHAFEIVHTHSSKPSILGRLAALLARTPSIFHTYHGFGHDFFKKPSRQILFRVFERFLNKKSQALIFVCEENQERAQFLSLLHPKNNFQIPDLLALDNFSKTPQNKRLLPVSNPVITSVLSFKDQKDPFSLVILCKKISEHYPEAEFHLIGDGPLLQECKHHAQSSKLKKIHFPGAVQNIEKYYRQTDLFIGASRFEGLSMAQLECLFFQIPLVITPAGGISRIMEHGKQGFFYTQGNLQEAFLFCNAILSGQFRYVPKDRTFFDIFDTEQIAQKHLEAYGLG